MFRRCINHFIKDIIQDDSCDTHAPTVPTSYLHQGPTIPPTSLNIQAAIPTCLKSNSNIQPSTLISISSMPTPPLASDLHCLHQPSSSPSAILDTHCLHQPPSNPTPMPNQLIPLVTSTNSNIKPSSPTSTTPSSNLELIPPMPSANSNIQLSTLTSISSMPTPPLASDLHCLHQPSSSPPPVLDTHCLHQPSSNPTPMPNQEIPLMTSAISNIQPSTPTRPINSIPYPPPASDLHYLHQFPSYPPPMLDTHCLHQPPSNPTPMSGQYILHQPPSTPPTCSNIKLFTPTCPNNTMGNSTPTPHLQQFPSVVPSNTSHCSSFNPSSGMNTISSITPSFNSNIKTVTPTFPNSLMPSPSSISPTFPNSLMPSPSSTSNQHCLHQPYITTFNTFNNQSPNPTYSNNSNSSLAPTVPPIISKIQSSSLTELRATSNCLNNNSSIDPLTHLKRVSSASPTTSMPDYSTTQFAPTSYQHDAPTVPPTLSNIQPFASTPLTQNSSNASFSSPNSKSNKSANILATAKLKSHESEITSYLCSKVDILTTQG
jgi:hypothetical protein